MKVAVAVAVAVGVGVKVAVAVGVKVAVGVGVAAGVPTISLGAAMLFSRPPRSGLVHTSEPVGL